MNCSRNGILREGESCRFNNNCSYPACVRPIIKFNGGAGALLCNTCGVIIKECLNSAEFGGRTHLLFCDEHWREFQDKTKEPDWVCFDCAKERGASPPKGHCYTVHPDTCGICKRENVGVTECRDFGVTRNRLRILK